LRESDKLKEPVIEEIFIEGGDMDEYLEPIEFAVEPPFEFMMIKAR
jgi:hypothetical protein